MGPHGSPTTAGAVSASLHHWIPSTGRHAWHPELADNLSFWHWRASITWGDKTLKYLGFVTQRSNDWQITSLCLNLFICKKKIIKFRGLLWELSMLSILLHLVSPQWVLSLKSMSIPIIEIRWFWLTRVNHPSKGPRVQSGQGSKYIWKFPSLDF